MESPGESGPASAGGGPGQALWQPQGLWLGATPGQSTASNSSSCHPWRVCWVFQSHLRQGDLQDLLSKYLRKGQKQKKVILQSRGLRIKTNDCVQRREGRLGRLLVPTPRAGTGWDKALGSSVSPAKGPENCRASHKAGPGHGQVLLVRWIILKKPGGQNFWRHHNALVNLKVKASVDLRISKWLCLRDMPGVAQPLWQPRGTALSLTAPQHPPPAPSQTPLTGTGGFAWISLCCSQLVIALPSAWC